MAISNYGELKTVMQTWLMGATPISSNAEDIVLLAQSYLNTHLRCREMETTTDLSPTSGVFTLPTDYAAWEQVTELNTWRNEIFYLSKKKADKKYPYRPSGVGCHFSITGTSLRVYPTITNDIELTYYQRLAAFSAESDTDWLLTRYPHVYLAACKTAGADLIQDDALYAKNSAQMLNFVNDINKQDDQNEFQSSEYEFEGHAP